MLQPSIALYWRKYFEIFSNYLDFSAKSNVVGGCRASHADRWKNVFCGISYLSVTRVQAEVSRAARAGRARVGPARRPAGLDARGWKRRGGAWAPERRGAGGPVRSACQFIDDTMLDKINDNKSGHISPQHSKNKEKLE